MSDEKRKTEDLIRSFKEREKELECLYGIDEILKRNDIDLDEAVSGIIEVIPSGWQYPDICRVMIRVGMDTYSSPEFQETPWILDADIEIQDKKAGEIRICYLDEKPESDDGPFMKQEKRLLRTIADRLGGFIQHRQMKAVLQGDSMEKLDLLKSGGEILLVSNFTLHGDARQGRRPSFTTLAEPQ